MPLVIRFHVAPPRVRRVSPKYGPLSVILAWHDPAPAERYFSWDDPSEDDRGGRAGKAPAHSRRRG